MISVLFNGENLKKLQVPKLEQLIRDGWIQLTTSICLKKLILVVSVLKLNIERNVFILSLKD